MKRKQLQIWLPLVLALVMIAGMFIGFKLSREQIGSVFFKNDKSSPLNEVLSLINKNYVDPVNTDSIQTETINRLLSQLDPHSLYIPPAQLQSINDALNGSFQGIGIEYQMLSDTAVVVNPIQYGPAEKAGMQIGDKLLALNDSIPLIKKGFTPDSVQTRLRDAKGATLQLTVLRNGKPLAVKVERGAIPLPSIDAAYLLDKQTAFIRINKFSETTYTEFMIGLDSLRKKGMKQLILDLRGNGGGLLDQAVNIADEFLSDNKLVVYTEGDKSGRADYRCKRDGLFEKGKLIVLIDENSASASEILSGALQDWDRATLIGRRTFGKGLVQQQFPLSNGGALRLTVAHYFTPLGRNIQKPYNKGIDAYQQDLSDRFKNGELEHGDTSHNRGKAYRTPAGHIVYGGGGITPDIFVPFDTTLQPQPVVELYTKGILNSFVLQYYLEQQSYLKQFKTAEDFYHNYHAGEKEWNALAAFSQNKGVDIRTINIKAKNELLRRIPAYLARFLWRTEGYFEILNHTDPFVVRAMTVLQEK